MPNINRIRVNNVKYNNGTQYYDDFNMSLQGKNTLYDLANGGGKSVLMLLLLQNVMPNCTLDEKQPLEKLFRSSEGSNVIHSLIEWNLDTHHVNNLGYEYMTTGFCAKKGKDATDSGEAIQKETAAIEYFNYCIFYRDFNDNDIRNLPLVKEKERITYKGLRKHLTELSLKNTSTILVKIFDKKYEYQNFLSEYGIYESEWEIIRGINKTEGHVRTYFETKYRTTRKVVEDLLIEEIIQKSFHTKTKKEDDEGELAQTLLDIKDKLFELSKKKKEINNYDRQIESLELLAQKAGILEQGYTRKSKAQGKLMGFGNSLNLRFDEVKEQFNQLSQSLIQNDNEKSEIARKIATLEYQVAQEDKDKLEQEIIELKQTVETYDEKVNIMIDKLNHGEAANEYFEYSSQKKSYEITASTILNIQKQNKDLLNELETYVYNKKIKNDKKMEQLSKEVELLNLQIQGAIDQIEELTIKERSVYKEHAIKERHVEELTLQLQELEKELSQQRKKVTILLLEEIDNEIESNKLRLKESLEKVEKYVSEYSQLQSMLNEDKILIGNINYKFNDLTQKELEVQGKITEFNLMEQRKSKLSAIYLEVNVTKLQILLEEKYRQTILEHSIKTMNKDRLIAYFHQLELNIPLEVTIETRQLLEHIEKNYKNGALGLEIMKEYSTEKLQEILARIPLLPYSIVVTPDIYLKLENDPKSLDIQQSSFAIPIINKRVLDGEEFIDTKGILFASKNVECFTNPEKLSLEKDRVKKELVKIEKEIEVLLANETAFKDNMAFMERFSNNYERYINDWRVTSNEITKTLQEAITIKDTTQKRITINNESVSTLISKKETLAKNIEELEENLQNFNQIKSIISNMDIKQRQLKADQILLVEMKRSQANLIERIKTQEYTRDTKRKIKDNLSQQMKIILEEWTRDYQTYYNKDEIKLLSVTDEELDIQLSGLKKAFEDKNTDIRLNNELLESYKKGFMKSMDIIKDKKIALSELELKYRNNTLVRTNEDEINKQKEEKTNLIIQRNVKKQLLEDHRIKASNIGGKLEIEQNQIRAKYGVFEYINVEPKQYLELINDYKGKRQAIEKAFQVIKNTHIHVKGEVDEIEHIVRETGYVIDLYKIKGVPTDKIEELPKEIHYATIFATVKLEMEQATTSAHRAFEHFEKDKNKCILELEDSLADALIKAVKDDVIIPRDSKECDQLIERLTNTCETITIEKNNIESSIKDMEAIKESFQNQCLQRCNNVKVDLDKFARLSSIILDNEKTQVIKLRIPYVKEEQQNYQISKYIDNLIEKIDEFSTDSDKKKYIMSHLALKKLFSVIVSDMNRISLELYKRERIKENSRHFRYEEAVGSTGQSQGIYIQFLIAIINYISNINSFQETTGLKKVIFIDNPFGAAKDTYIWDPIFNMLETNMVQLVVPTRGATPAITGRFDVNYILVQKMVDGRQQTVVSTDYRSEIDAEATEYRKADYKQEKLTF